MSGRVKNVEGDKHPYLRITFRIDPSNWFWESPSHTEKSKKYFRDNLAKAMENIHNKVRVENMDSKT